MAGNIVELNDSNFQQEVHHSPIPVLVDFWAPWCAPCRQLTPTIAELAQEYDGKVKVAKFNTDAGIEVATRYQIERIPTVLIFKSGEVVGRLEGLNPKKQFQEMLNRV